jgi:hypothetical protein
MRFWAPFTLLVATTVALQSPHRKTASLKQRTSQFSKRDVQHIQTSHQYLNEETESESPKG